MNLAGDHLLGDENCRRIVAQADGVPLFAEELTKMFLERIVAAEPGDAKPAIPLTLLDSLAARLDNLGAAKETAQWAAAVSYTHLRAHETVLDIVCRLLLEKKNTKHHPNRPTQVYSGTTQSSPRHV